MLNDAILIYPFDVKALMRVQEFYENPEYRGKVASREQIEEWNQRVHGESYGETWDGFNFPVASAQSFFRQANALFPEEVLLKRQIEQNPRAKYVISALAPQMLRHEQIHALYDINQSYRSTVHALYQTMNIKKFNCIRDALIAQGYSGAVVLDEVNAYLGNADLPDIGLANEEFKAEISLFSALYEFFALS